MRIVNNIAALNATNIKAKNTKALSKSIENLSSGLRINKAADDAAGLAISQKMRAQIRGLSQASRNAQDGISLIQTAEGAVGEMTDIAQRMRELCVQGANGTLTDDDREKIQSELNNLKQELASIASNTEFNTKKLLDGSLSNYQSEIINSDSGTISDMLSLDIPTDGTTLIHSVTVDNEELEFSVTDNQSGTIHVVVKNQGTVIGEELFVQDLPLDPTVTWVSSFGGWDTDVGYSTIETNDGGYITVGYTQSPDGDISNFKGMSDVWVVKVDSAGVLEWEKTYGGSLFDFGNNIKQTSDNGFILSGVTYSSDGDISDAKGGSDVWFLKTDSLGNLEWEKTMGGSSDDMTPQMIETSTGDFILSYSNPISHGIPGSHGLTDINIMKVDSMGTVLWENLYGGSSSEIDTRLLLTNADEIIFAASSGSNNGDVSGNNGNNDVWIAKLDVNGNIIEQDSFGGSSVERLYEIQSTIDGGLLVLGTSRSSNGDLTGNYGNEDAWLFKLDSSGIVQWSKNLGGSNFESPSSSLAMNQTNDGGILLNLRSNSVDGDLTVNNGSYDNWIVKLDLNGNILWDTVIGDSNSNSSRGICLTSDGGFVVNSSYLDSSLPDNQGFTDFGLAKYDSDGNLEWQKSFGSASFDSLSHILEDSNGDLILTGSLKSNLGIIKVSQNYVQGSDEQYIELDSIVKGNTIISFDNVKLNFNDEKLQKLSGIEFEWSSNTFSEEGINNSMLLQLGANAGQIMTIAIDDMRPEALGFINGMPRVNPIEMAGVSITLTDQAIMRISTQRSTLGAYQNRLEHVIRNLDNSAENLQAAESRITDLDMAKGVSEMTKFNILSQAADAMIAQANQQPQGILQLLK